MGSSRWPIMEISRSVKDDPHANRLLDEFFDACFANVSAPFWTPLHNRHKEGEERIASSLVALNAWLRSWDADAEVLLPPAEMSLEDWAEELALQFLTNSPC